MLLSPDAFKMSADGWRMKDERGNKLNGHQDIPKPFLIGVGGGTASGKSTVCQNIMEQLGQNDLEQGQKQVEIISLESFYRPLTEEEHKQAARGQYNFDHPGAFDKELIINTLNELKQGKTVAVPEYDFVTHRRKPNEFKTVYPADVILFEGILIFYYKQVRSMFDMKLFVDTDADIRLTRRVKRDMEERERALDHILHQYTTFVKPAFEEFCQPTKKHADVIIPRGADNQVAIELIVQHIQDILRPDKERVAHKRVRHNSDTLMVFKYPDDPKYISAH